MIDDYNYDTWYMIDDYNYDTWYMIDDYNYDTWYMKDDYNYDTWDDYNYDTWYMIDDYNYDYDYDYNYDTWYMTRYTLNLSSSCSRDRRSASLSMKTNSCVLSCESCLTRSRLNLSVRSASQRISQSLRSARLSRRVAWCAFRRTRLGLELGLDLEGRLGLGLSDGSLDAPFDERGCCGVRRERQLVFDGNGHAPGRLGLGLGPGLGWGWS